MGRNKTTGKYLSYTLKDCNIIFFLELFENYIIFI